MGDADAQKLNPREVLKVVSRGSREDERSIWGQLGLEAMNDSGRDPVSHILGKERPGGIASAQELATAGTQMSET